VVITMPLPRQKHERQTLIADTRRQSWRLGNLTIPN
jgi:hypothetical protein